MVTAYSRNLQLQNPGILQLLELFHQRSTFRVHGINPVSVLFAWKVHVTDKIPRQTQLFYLHNPLVDIRYYLLENVRVRSDDLAQLSEIYIVDHVVSGIRVPRILQIVNSYFLGVLPDA